MGMGKRQITSLIVCIALLGFMLTPASYIPCCCSDAHPAVEKKAPSCCSAKKQVADCCSGKKSEFACTVAKILRMPLKRDCRCLEQITTVALPMFSGHANKKVRGPGMVLASAITVHIPSMTRQEAAPERGATHPGIVIRLKTCTLLC
jgi:hypothetical protein